MRWEKIQDERRQERNRITEARDQMVLNPRNNSNRYGHCLCRMPFHSHSCSQPRRIIHFYCSVPYNPVTLEYNDTLEGARLQQKHEFVKVCLLSNQRDEQLQPFSQVRDGCVVSGHHSIQESSRQILMWIQSHHG